MARPDTFNVWRALSALFFGAILGAFLTALIIVLPAVFDSRSGVTPGQVAVISVYVFVVAFFIWGIGLVMLGAPFWAALHALGFRGYVSAGALGFTLTFLFLFLVAISNGPEMSCFANDVCHWKNGKITSEGFQSALWGSLVLGIGGLAVGLYIRFLAYRDD